MNQDQLRDALDEFDIELTRWASAYPISVFPEPDFEKAHEALQAAGMTLDAVSASNMRYVLTKLNELFQPVRAALTAHQQAAPSQGAGELSNAVLAALDALGDGAAVHIHPDKLDQCLRSECVVKVCSVRVTDVETGVKYVPLFSREQIAAALLEASAQREQPAEDVRDAETELNCAEEVLDAISASLDMKQTAFDCIGDYITAVIEAIKNQQPAPQAQAGEPIAVAWLDPVYGLSWLVERTTIAPGAKFITLQSYREAMAEVASQRDDAEGRFHIAFDECAIKNTAIAEKDAALKACVEALEFYAKNLFRRKSNNEPCIQTAIEHDCGDIARAAIKQGQGALQ